MYQTLSKLCNDNRKSTSSILDNNKFLNVEDINYCKYCNDIAIPPGIGYKCSCDKEKQPFIEELVNSIPAFYKTTCSACTK